MTSWRQRVGHWVEHRSFQSSIMVLIVFNAILLGLETSKTVMNSPFGPWILRLDALCLSVFVAELALAIFAYGTRFFRDPWRIFDFLVVGIALAPAGGGFSVLRGLRVLRVLRLVHAAPSLKRIINAMLEAIPGIGSIAGLLGIIYYVAAVMATKLFGDHFPEWFGSLGASFYTLFQVMTLESWSMGIVRPVMEQFPLAWAFFVPFIMVATFTMLNLFVGVIVSAMQAAAAPNDDSDVAAISPSKVLAEIKLKQIADQLDEVRRELAGVSEKSHVP